ncbi:SIFamide-related peptide [Diorhabda carinulata]|uniref:SIFamide-related peptide n=1 Tax=Diorhabda sublineata TaxID=1163346 RepID=UPI0024E077AD|nr:SIFamide-related peptide [Diorhabda sublineata]XP_057654022.1 SIFamide-related peptide [Diorhabda carinulata]
MNSKLQRTLAIFFVVAIVMFGVISSSDAAYRRPPFNGSIFGKRTTGNNDFENAGKALSAMCEIASEACASWFPTQDK